MDDVSRIKDRATRLFALALRAREQDHASADELTKLAHETLTHAEDLERRRPILGSTTAAQQPAQQQRQPQSKTDDETA